MTTKQSDWRVAAMNRIRALITAADPKITEEIKYRKPTNPAGIPVWYRDGMICTGETYREHLRLTFSKGHQIKKNKKVLNSYRALVIREGDRLNETAFKALIQRSCFPQREACKEGKALLQKTLNYRCIGTSTANT